MRQLEQFSLRWEHVDLERGVLTLAATKSGGVQYVRLNEEAKAIFRNLDSWQRSVWVFPSENPATHADPRNFYRRVYLPKLRTVGLESVTWHTLRHTFASRLAMGGATLLRHTGTTLVRPYAHLSPSHLQDALERVAAFGKGGPPTHATVESHPKDEVHGDARGRTAGADDQTEEAALGANRDKNRDAVTEKASR
jgi:site-specific recombinase XerD